LPTIFWFSIMLHLQESAHASRVATHSSMLPTRLQPVASDVEKLMTQLQGLVDAGNSVVVVEHDMSVAAASDWIIDVGPGAGDEGGTIVVSGTPKEVSSISLSHTAQYLAECLDDATDRVNRFEKHEDCARRRIQDPRGAAGDR
jgi:hypothetical protein